MPKMPKYLQTFVCVYRQTVACSQFTVKIKSSGFFLSTMQPQSSMPLIYCWLTSCTDLCLHYLPLFNHKARFIASLNAKLLKILYSLLHHLLLPLYCQSPLLVWSLTVEKVRVTGGIVKDSVDDQKTHATALSS